MSEIFNDLDLDFESLINIVDLEKQIFHKEENDLNYTESTANSENIGMRAY
jgi:hypothetical protein